MEILDHTSIQMMLFLTLYSTTGVVPLIGALYLLLRRGNAIAPDVTPPARLRRWAAAFFGVTALAHVWWMLFYFYCGDLNSVSYLLVVTLDCVLLFTTFSGMLLAMLQDRRRPVWPALTLMIPFVALAVADMVYPSRILVLTIAAYLLLVSLLFSGYMVFAIRQYGRWLNDNYADLENKKVWLCQTVSLVCMLLFVLYVLATDMVLIWLIHIVALVLFGLLLWRVETLPQLDSIPMAEASCPTPHQSTSDTEQPTPDTARKSVLISNVDIEQIRQLLSERCEATQLYLQHDISREQLAQAVNTNRYYLSQYFSRQGITYNTYINNLRINHFIRCYEASVAAREPVSAQQLAYESGFSSYRTFSRAFLQRTNQSVTAWMDDTAAKRH